MPHAIVIDSDATHGGNVRDYFLATLALRGVTGWTCDIEETVPEAVVRAEAGEAVLLIRSLVNLWAFKTIWDAMLYDHGVQVVHAHGSNDASPLPSPLRIASAVAVGGEDPLTPGGETSHGPGLEGDARAYDGAAVQSFATPTWAALMAEAYDRTGNWYNARALVRQAASNYDAGWAPETGFGYVRHDAVLPGVAALQPPLDIVVSVAGAVVSASWRPFQTSSWARTVVTVDGAEVYAGAGTSFDFAAPASGTYELVFYSEDAEGQRSRLESFAVAVVPVVVVPSAPAGLQATRSADHVSCALACELAGGIEAYRWYRSTSRYAALQLVAETAAPEHVDTELEPGRPYVYEVRGLAGGAEYASGERVTARARRSERLRVRPAALA